MTRRRPHEEVMRDYITLLKRDAEEYITARSIARAFDDGMTTSEARRRIRQSHPYRKRKKRIREAKDHLERYLAGVAYWKEREEASSTPEEQ